MTEGNGDIRYTMKEMLSRIEGKLDMLATQMQQKADISQVASLTGRVEMLERDMQEGKETVKSMLLPDFHATKQRVEAAQQQTNRRLDKLELESASQVAVGSYRKWLIATAVPALIGAGYAVVRLLELVGR